MERGSTKHGPRLDQEMAHEVRGIVQSGVDSRVEEARDPEPSGEDQPATSRVPGGTPTGGAPPGMTYEEVEGRSRLGRYIPMASLPGDRAALLAGARTMNAPDDVLAELGRLPEGERYETVNQIWAALGHHNEERRT
jgi:Protein of unknown function (DUF2795)